MRAIHGPCVRTEAFGERMLQEAIIQAATLLGWSHFHAYDMRRSDIGWPDLVLCRPPRLIVAELKAESGRLTPAQRAWGELLAACPGIEYHLWRPAQWVDGTVEAVLRGGEGERALTAEGGQAQ